MKADPPGQQPCGRAQHCPHLPKQEPEARVQRHSTRSGRSGDQPTTTGSQRPRGTASPSRTQETETPSGIPNCSMIMEKGVQDHGERWGWQFNWCAGWKVMDPGLPARATRSGHQLGSGWGRKEGKEAGKEKTVCIRINVWNAESTMSPSLSS